MTMPSSLTEAQLHVESHLRALLGRDYFTLSADGRGVVTAGGASVVVDVPAEGRWAVFSAAVGTLPADAAQRLAVLEAALQFNLFLAEGDGAAVAATPSGDGSLYLCYRAPVAGLDATQIANLITNLAAKAAALEARLQALAPAAQPRGAMPAAAPAATEPTAQQILAWRA